MESDYLAENPLGEDAHATFGFYGDALKPNEVSRRLEITPDLARSRGDSIPSRTGTIIQRTGVWLFWSERHIRSTSLERHIEFLLEKLEPRRADVLQLCVDFGAEAVFSCYWVPASFHGGPILSASLVKRIAGLGAALWFDIYADMRDPEDSGSPQV